MKLTIGTASANPGEKISGFLEISKSSAGYPIGLPVNIVNGKQSGPTLVANAAMHGSETLGTVAISRLYKNLDTTQLKGTFIGIPIFNMFAFEAEHRLPTLFDSFNMERLFPGNEFGTISERIAFTFMNEIARKADCLIDFHGQDSYWRPTSSIITPTPISEGGNIEQSAYQKCLNASKAFGVHQIWRTNKPGSVTESIINEKGIAAISPEFGGVNDYKRVNEYYDLAIQGITNIMKWMGILEGEITPKDYQTCVCDLNRILNKFGGMWSTNVEVEDYLEEGDLVGTIHDPITAEILEEIRAPFSGVITNLWSAPVIKPAVMVLGMGKVIEYI